jgi:hypothetical protein
MTQRKVRSEIRAVARLTPEERIRMYRILEKYYAHVTEQDFLRDLSGKSEVILLKDNEKGEIQGFSTLLFFTVPVRGGTTRGVFSGDTIVEEEFWGQTALQSAFVRRLLQERFKTPWKPLYWFLISKGYKTYLLMANNFTHYYPSAEGYPGGFRTESRLRLVAHTFARKLFGADFHPEEGLIRFQGVPPRLKAERACVTPQDLERTAKIRFFSIRNPGWANGDELVCVGQLNGAMVLKFALKLLRKRIRGRRAPQAAVPLERPL